jgi:hypothetical protein
MYDEQDEFPTPEPDAVDQLESATRDPKVIVQFMGLDAHRIEEMVADTLSRRVEKEVELVSRLRKLAADKLDDRVDDIVEERVRAEVTAILDEGWDVTDQYGARTGQRVTLRDRVGEILHKRDSYHRKAWLDEKVEGCVKAIIDRDFSAEIEKAKTDFRKQADELLAGKIADMLRAALGLR